MKPLLFCLSPVYDFHFLDLFSRCDILGVHHYWRTRMNSFKMGLVTVCLSAFLLMGCGAKERVVTISPAGNEMKYLETEFTVTAGEQIKLVMKNTATMDIMKHNVVILNDETAIEAVGLASANEADYIPDHPAIVAATPMAGPGETTEVSFTAPLEKGTYIFICTYPGHYRMMQGKMIVN